MFYVQDPRQRQEVIRRAARALVTLTNDLLESAQAFAREWDLHWTYDPAVLMIGPELLRKPFFEQFNPRELLRKIYAPMNGREELYCQIGDLMNLLSLQQLLITHDDQRSVSRKIEAMVGLWIPAQYIVWMTDRECEGAITRLASSAPQPFRPPRPRRCVARASLSCSTPRTVLITSEITRDGQPRSGPWG
jgi:hypothetical protein